MQFGCINIIAGILSGNIAVSYRWKVTDAKNLAALLNTLSSSFLANSYDVSTGMLTETSFLFDLCLETPSTLYNFFTLCRKNNIISQSHKIVDDPKTKQCVNNFNTSLHYSMVLIHWLQ